MAANAIAKYHQRRAAMENIEHHVSKASMRLFFRACQRGDNLNAAVVAGAYTRPHFSTN